MRTPIARRWLVCALACAIAAGCARRSGVCDPGESRPCPCSDGRTVTQRCNSDGTAFDPCGCAGAGPDLAAGNGVDFAVAACAPGDSIDCSCADGAASRAFCLPDQSGFGACRCDGPPLDSAVAIDLVSARDIQAFGCLDDRDCGGGTPRCDPASRKCVPCLPPGNGVPDNCPPDTYCARANAGFACVAGCKVDADCPSGDADAGRPGCCNHVCLDLTSDPHNCGDCGSVCALGSSCCAAKCADTTRDPLNCGGCGLGCAARPHAAPACMMAQCGVGACDASWFDCNGFRGDGCEANLQVDANNCGACGTTCFGLNAVESCAAGACVVVSCAVNFGDCDRKAANGCESDLRTDVNNCGACGKGCAAPMGKTAVCVASACGVK